MKVGSNITSLSDAVASIQDSSTVFIGGYFFYRHPMAAVREIIRQRKCDFTIIVPLSGIEADMLIGAGCVRHVIFGFLSLDMLGMAPCFRRKVESGAVTHEDYGDLALIRSIEAAQREVGYVAVRAWLGSDMLKYHRGKVIEAFGERLLAVPSLRPDVAVLHAQWADTEGNVAIEGDCYDVDAMKAADRVIVTCERLVSPDELRRMGKMIVPRYRVEHLVELQYGAHPCSTFPYYAHDMRHLLEYAEAAQTEAGFGAYLDRYVYGASSHPDYLEGIGGSEKLIKLERIMNAGIRYIRDKERVHANI